MSKIERFLIYLGGTFIGAFSLWLSIPLFREAFNVPIGKKFLFFLIPGSIVCIAGVSVTIFAYHRFTTLNKVFDQSIKNTGVKLAKIDPRIIMTVASIIVMLLMGLYLAITK